MAHEFVARNGLIINEITQGKLGYDFLVAPTGGGLVYQRTALEVLEDLDTIVGVNATNISNVVFTTARGNTIEESFSHSHTEYLLASSYVSPVITNNYVAVGTGTGIEGTDSLQFDGTNLDVAGYVGIGTLAKLIPQATAPTSPSTGWIYMSTDTHLYVYNGTTWKQLDN